jgi:hypothetical protein
MPGQFINTGNAGKLTLTNNSNSGQAVFTFSGSVPNLYNATVDGGGYGVANDACVNGNPVTPLWATTTNPLTATFYADSNGTTLALVTYPSLFDGQYHKLLLNSIYYAVKFAVDSTIANSTPC